MDHALLKKDLFEQLEIKFNQLIVKEQDKSQYKMNGRFCGSKLLNSRIKSAHHTAAHTRRNQAFSRRYYP